MLALEKLSVSAAVRTDFFNNIGGKPSFAAARTNGRNARQMRMLRQRFNCVDGVAPSYPRARKSRGALPVAFRNARAKLAGDEYPSSAETWMIEPLV